LVQYGVLDSEGMYFLGDPGKDLKCLEMAKNGHDGVPVFWRTTRFLPLPSTYYVDMKQNLYKDNLKHIIIPFHDFVPKANLLYFC